MQNLQYNKLHCMVKHLLVLPEKKTERERQTDTDRDRGRQTDKQTGERERERQTDRQIQFRDSSEYYERKYENIFNGAFTFFLFFISETRFIGGHYICSPVENLDISHRQPE